MATVSTQVPSSFLCAITHDIMNVPMIDPEGNTYEKAAIEQWLYNHTTSPITRNNLYVSQLNYNRALKDAIDEYKQRNGLPVDGASSVSSAPPANITRVEVNDLELVKLRTSSYKVDEGVKEVYVNIDIEPEKGSVAVPKDIVAVIDVSGSMDSAATVNDENGKEVDVGFSLLDITKHALKTIVESMGTNDRLSIITFSDDAKVITDMTIMTDANKSLFKTKITNLNTEGSTNLWEGIRSGLNQFKNINDPEFRTQALLVLTDGVPSRHHEPTQGVVGALKKYLSKLSSNDIIPTIYTYGFGYSLDTPLLAEIASVGKGNFSFIPDSGFVGTVFVNSIANISTTIGRNSTLYYQTVNGASIKNIIGYNDGIESSIGTIHYGQKKSLVLVMDVRDTSREYLDITLHYTGVSGKYINKHIKASTNPIIKQVRGNNDEIGNTMLRLEFANLGFNIIRNDQSIALSQELVKKFLHDNDNMNQHPIMVDVKSQVEVAISCIEYYRKWGKNYLYSLVSAHKQQRCNNFKDKSVQDYGGELFRELRDKYDDIFDSMPAPVPSRRVYNADVGYSTNNTPVDMSRFNNVNNGCYHENSIVHMANGTFKKCSEVVKGDLVLTLEGYTATVVCVVKSNCKDGVFEMNTFDNGLIITPYHPIYYNGDWIFPTNVNNNLKNVSCSAVYSYILSNHHSVIVNNIPCITLGHNSNHPVLKHDYFGNKVIQHLAEMPGYENGLLHFQYGSIMRDSDDNVIGFDVSRLV